MDDDGQELSPEERIGLLQDYLRAALDWIDAVPKEVADRLPAMPGFDRDEAESLLAPAGAPSPGR